MATLKPCPFCGGGAYIHKRLNTPYYAAVCNNTKCPGHNLYVLYWNETEAVEAWNRRVFDPLVNISEEVRRGRNAD